MYIGTSIRSKLNDLGFNIIAVRFIGGRSNICVCAWFDEKEDTKPFCTITEIGELDPFNSILLTCCYGTKLNESELNGFFPNIKEQAIKLKKLYPRYFQNNNFYQ